MLTLNSNTIVIDLPEGAKIEFLKEKVMIWKKKGEGYASLVESKGVKNPVYLRRKQPSALKKA